jgi:hypothetical protein
VTVNIQIRDVPDDLRDRLAEVAKENRLSLSRFLLQELEHIDRRRAQIRHNREVLDATVKAVLAIDPDAPNKVVVLEALDEGRSER